MAMGISVFYTSNILAQNDLGTVSLEDTNEIQGTSIGEVKDTSTFSMMAPKTNNDITSTIDVIDIKAWLSGNLVYEQGGTTSFPTSIYSGSAFKVALNWQAKDTAMTYQEGDTFNIKIGVVEGLLLEPSTTEKLYIHNIYVADSILSYGANKELTYRVVFNANISYFQGLQGKFTNSSTFKNVETDENVRLEFDAGSTGYITITKRPTPPIGGDVGIGLPTVPTENKDLITMGKDTYFEDYDNPVFGWRVVFTDLLHENQQNISTPDFKEYENVIIEDTLDENQVFMYEAESGFGLPFYFDIPIMLPGTQNAVAYTTVVNSSNRVNRVEIKGNGNSDYIIKPTADKFAKLDTEEAVRRTPLSWTIVEVGNRQKIIINIGKLGTTLKTEGITTDMVTNRFIENPNNAIDNIANVIQVEIDTYESVLQHAYSPYNTIQKKFKELKDSNAYDSTNADFLTYTAQLAAFINTNASNGVLNKDVVPPVIPSSLQLTNTPTYTTFANAVSNYKVNMEDYVAQMSADSDYMKNVTKTIADLKKAKTYYQAQPKRIYGFNLKYKTEATNVSSGKVTNEVCITTDQKIFEIETEVKHKFQSGIEGVFAKGDVVIMKADSAYQYTDSMLSNTKDLIGMKDVQFEAYDATTNEKLFFFDKTMNVNQAYRFYGTSATVDPFDSNFTSKLVSDEHGKLVLSGLLPTKQYYLKEVQAVDGYYDASNQSIPFVVNAKEVNYKLIENVSRSVTLRKVDKQKDVSGNYLPLENVEFALYDQNDKKITNFKKETINGIAYVTYTNELGRNEKLLTSSDGTLHIKNLPAGKYYLKEEVALNGYILSSEKHRFELAQEYREGSTIIDLGDVYNLKTDASITIQKVDDQDRDIALKGASFELYQRSGSAAWGSGSHDAWSLVDASQFDLNNTFVSANTIDGNALLTNSEGTLSISALPIGDYYLKEVKAPDGYKVEDKHYHFTIETLTKASKLYSSNDENEDVMEEVVQNKIQNQKGYASIKLVKYDRFEGASVDVNGVSQSLDQVFYEGDITTMTINKPLAGVTFDLYRKDKDTIDIHTDSKIASTLTTNQYGELQVHSLPVGTYYFVETKTLPNYQLKQDPILVEVTNEDIQGTAKTLVKLVDNRYIDYQIHLIKQDKDSTATLADAYFQMYTSDGKLMKFTYDGATGAYLRDDAGSSTLITNKDGKIVVRDLTSQQMYYFKETKSPQGYKIDIENNKYEVMIKSVEASYVGDDIVIGERICKNEKLKESDKPTLPMVPNLPSTPLTITNQPRQGPKTMDIENHCKEVFVVSGLILLAVYIKRKHYVK